MEAMNWSLPVVATDVGDNNLLVKNGIGGYLVEIGNYTAFAKHLTFLLESYESRLLMGKAGHDNLYNFSSEAFENNYLEILKTKI